MGFCDDFLFVWCGCKRKFCFFVKCDDLFVDVV